MKEWYMISTEESYITERYYLNHTQYFCPKCGYFRGGNLYDLAIGSIHDEIAKICEIDKIIVNERGKEVLENICPADIAIQAIKIGRASCRERV